MHSTPFGFLANQAAGVGVHAEPINGDVSGGSGDETEAEQGDASMAGDQRCPGEQ